jgi:hypothetical protein
MKLTKNFFLGILITSMMLFVTSCATNVSFLNSSVVPAAKGKVKIKKGNNKNYNIQVEIKDLAEVERLQMSKETYLVWMETERGIFENLGQLSNKTGFMSKQHTASFETTSPFKPIRIFITAENESNVRYPSSEDILTTDKFYK